MYWTGKHRPDDNNQEIPTFMRPTQAGRFKPRKPAKRIVRPTDTVDVDNAARASPPAPPAAGRGRGRRGRGRARSGGRGGRGTVITNDSPAFFTGASTSMSVNPTPVASNSTVERVAGGASTDTTTRRSKTPRKLRPSVIEDAHDDETVVGEMETGVGGATAAPAPDTVESAPRRQKKTAKKKTAPPTSRNLAPIIIRDKGICYYDDDSSVEDEQQEVDDDEDVIIVDANDTAPLRFPAPQATSLVDAFTNLDIPTAAAATTSNPLDTSQPFLLQLPTRLPIQAPETKKDNDNDDDNNDEVQVFVPTVPAVQPHCRDVLSSTPQCLGQLCVHASGKITLVMGGHQIHTVRPGVLSQATTTTTATAVQRVGVMLDDEASTTTTTLRLDPERLHNVSWVVTPEL